jgi:hypothetical protein
MRYHVLATMAVATLLLVGALGQDSGKSEGTDQHQQQSTETRAMKCMTGKGQMTEEWKIQDAELDKLIFASRSQVFGSRSGSEAGSSLLFPTIAARAIFIGSVILLPEFLCGFTRGLYFPFCK